MIKLLDDPDPVVQLESIKGLENAGPVRIQAVPALVNLLNRSNQSDLNWGRARVQEAAILLLGKIGPDAKDAIPTLNRLLRDRNPRLRQRSAVALWRIDKDPSVVGRLTAELAEARDYQSCAMLIISLGEIGPPAKDAVPVILEKATQQNAPRDRYALRSLRDVARRALAKIDPEAAEAMIRSGNAAPDLRAGALLDDSTARKLGLEPGQQ
jgi:HEAT repeat protein